MTRNKNSVFWVLLIFTSLPVWGDVQVRQDEALVEVDNGMVRAVFEVSETGVDQEYYASTSSGWKLVAKGFRPPADRPEGSLPLFSNGPNVAREHRLVATE
ncbi:hypothetical protein MYX84_06465, partial [Acidobacteria bacterium AH-259-O06]|nr:hypothetical protein [Acidobacteria bacterium AH-259-O06]